MRRNHEIVICLMQIIIGYMYINREGDGVSDQRTAQTAEPRKIKFAVQVYSFYDLRVYLEKTKIIFMISQTRNNFDIFFFYHEVGGVFIKIFLSRIISFKTTF